MVDVCVFPVSIKLANIKQIANIAYNKEPKKLT